MKDEECRAIIDRMEGRLKKEARGTRHIEKIRGMCKDLCSNKGKDARLRWGMMLRNDERRYFFSSEEIKKIIEMRKRCIGVKKTMEALGCTQAELDRWDRLNLLPHAYKYYSTGFGKGVWMRQWLLDDIEYFKNRIDLIRAFN